MDFLIFWENGPLAAFYLLRGILERARKHLLENRGQSRKAEFVGFNGAWKKES